MHGRLDVRVVPNDAVAAEVPGVVRYWIRTREEVVNDSAFLAILGDFVPTALGSFLPPGRMSSLDNVLRVLSPPTAGWILCETTALNVRDGLAHGAMQLYAENGSLLAVADQSVIVRS